MTDKNVADNKETLGHIVVKFTNSRGKIIQEAYNGLLSRVFQHEYDHLDGICYIDRVSK